LVSAAASTSRTTIVRLANGLEMPPSPAACAGAEALHHERLAHMRLGNDQVVDVEVVIVFRVGDRAFQRLADVERNALLRELEIRERDIDALAADELGQEVELLRAHAKHPAHGLGFVLLEGARRLFLRHGQPLFAFLSAAWPWKVRVGENSPSLWPIMSSVTSTGTCLCPL